MSHEWTTVFARAQGLLPSPGGCRQNSVPCGCRTEVLVFFLSVGIAFHLLDDACGLFHNMATYFLRALRIIFL